MIASRNIRGRSFLPVQQKEQTIFPPNPVEMYILSSLQQTKCSRKELSSCRLNRRINTNQPIENQIQSLLVPFIQKPKIGLIFVRHIGNQRHCQNERFH